MKKYKFAIMSPHLDDGVLSCGEFIKKVIDAGHDVTIVTVFTGYPKAGELSDAAKLYHARCFLSDDSMEVRKIEDKQACNFLGCKVLHLSYFECLYRKNNSGEFIYPNLSSIYYLNSQDGDMERRLLIDLPIIMRNYDYIFAPIGLGKHADHLLLNKVIERWGITCNKKIFYYEEIPYLCYMQEEGEEVFVRGKKSYIIDVSEAQWQAKVQAILYYRSQLHIMWRDENERISQLRRASSAYGAGHKIRFWG